MRVLISFSTILFMFFSVASAETTSKLKVGDEAPDFTLTAAVTKEEISLNQFRGKKNVVLSFVPRAWDPVCSLQWPGYNAAKETFEKHNAVLLGITVDNVETLLGWIRHMCPGDTRLWFPILSDFWPHGGVAEKYGVLRSDGYSERATFLIDMRGIVRHINVHDVNKIPPFDDLVKALEKLNER
jgi:peroxiredoxin (alkyl hydroperoxide reductase subunit C)